MWKKAVDTYKEGLSTDERVIFKKKNFALEDFPIIRGKWELLIRSNKTRVTILQRIIGDLLQQNGLIEKLTDWARTIVRRLFCTLAHCYRHFLPRRCSGVSFRFS